MLAAARARRADRHPRAERRASAAPTASSRRGSRPSPPARPRCAAPRRCAPRSCRPAIRCGRRCCAAAETPYPRARPPTGRSACSSSAAARARASCPIWCRRRSPLLPEALRARLAIVQQCRPEDLDARRGGLRGARRRRRAGAVLPRPAAAHRRQPSGRLPLRRLDRRRTGGDRPAGDHGAAARRARPGPEGQRHGAGRAPAAAGWSSRRDMTPGAARRRSGRPDGRSGAAGRRCRRGAPDMRPAGCGRAPRRLVERVAAGASAGGTGVTRMKMPRDIGPVHFVGIGGIGMSGIAEVLVNLGYRVQGSDVADNANVQRLREKGIADRHRPRRRQSRRGAGGGRLLGDQARQSRAQGGARAPAAGGAPRRDAGRADAPQAGDRRRRHPRQDDHDLDGGGAARCRRPRSDRHQWRHHQRLRHQCAHGRRRLDGGRGRRIRRHLRQAAGRRRAGHQHRSRSISTTTAPSTGCARPSASSSRTCRSTASR